jgi:hypothetical protein
VLDDVEGWPLLVEPAGEDAPPAIVDLLHVYLEKSASQLVGLPRSSPVAGAQAHDQVSAAAGLAGLELELARHAVALVEQSEHRHALVHRSRGGLERTHVGADRNYVGAARRSPGAAGGDDEVVGTIVAGPAAAAACPEGEQQRRRRCSCGAAPHASGVHAS